MTKDELTEANRQLYALLRIVEQERDEAIAKAEKHGERIDKRTLVTETLIFAT
jgi:hypothetical protein